MKMVLLTAFALLLSLSGVALAAEEQTVRAILQPVSDRKPARTAPAARPGRRGPAGGPGPPRRRRSGARAGPAGHDHDLRAAGRGQGLRVVPAAARPAVGPVGRAAAADGAGRQRAADPGAAAGAV